MGVNVALVERVVCGGGEELESLKWERKSEMRIRKALGCALIPLVEAKTKGEHDCGLLTMVESRDVVR